MTNSKVKVIGQILRSRWDKISTTVWMADRGVISIYLRFKFTKTISARASPRPTRSLLTTDFKCAASLRDEQWGEERGSRNFGKDI